MLKVVYLQKKQNRRIDHLLSTLLKVARDKGFQRLRKLEVGKTSHRICEINKRHKSATLMSSSDIQESGEDKWIVASQTNRQLYTIEKLIESCECQVKCQICQICPHMYSCTCLDATIHATICKHIHLLQMTTLCDEQLHEMQPPSPVDYAYFENIGIFKNKGDSNITAVSKQRFINDLHQLENIVMSCENNNAIIAGRKLLSSVFHLIKATNSQSTEVKPELTRKRMYASTKQMDKQLKFFSTKKKRKSETPVLSKPSLRQTIQCKETLNSTETLFCGLCLKENDVHHENKLVDWISCAGANLEVVQIGPGPPKARTQTI